MAAAMVRRNSSRRRRTAESEEHRSQIDGGYDPYGPVHLLGNGRLTEREKK